MFRFRNNHLLIKLLKYHTVGTCWLKILPSFFFLYVIPILAFSFLVGVQVWDQRYQATCSYPGRHADAGGSGLAAPRPWMNVWIWRGRGNMGTVLWTRIPSDLKLLWSVRYGTVPVYRYLSISFLIWIRNNFERKRFFLTFNELRYFRTFFLLLLVGTTVPVLLRVTFTLTHTNTYLHLQVITTSTPIPTHIGTSLKPKLHLRGTHTATPTPNTYLYLHLRLS